MKILNNFKKKVKKSIASVMALFTMASVITVPNMTTVVNADSGLDVSTAFQQVVGSHTGKGNWHYSYQGGKNWSTIMGDGDPSADTYYNIGLDCTAGSIAVVARAIKNAGGNPRDYFGMLESSLNNVYPPSMISSFESNGKWTKVASGYVDSSALQTGDILIYGTVGQNGHMSVYAGNNTTIDFTSGGAGTETYTGYARNDLAYSDGGTSTSGSYSLTAIFRANMSKDVTISLTKTSGNTSITNGLVNAYSLNGAVYGIYSDSSANTQIGTITTDANGTGTTTVTVDSSTSTLFYKELTAPKGYCLNTAVTPFSFTGTSATVNTSDMPGNDPFSITLSKKNAMTDGEEPASLEGAQFTIKYYDLDPSADYTAEQLANMAPTRTWIIETKLTNGKYRARLNANYLVEDSDELYYVGSISTIPVGVISVEETKAPTITYTDSEGNEQLVYTLNNKTLNGDGAEILESNGTVVMKVSGDQNSYYLVGGNEYTISETPKKGGFYMTKIDDETNKAEPQGNGSLDGAYYEVYNDNDYQVGSTQVASANKGEKVWSFTTSNGGVYSAGLDTLQVGHYIVKEVDPSTGYQVAGTTERTLIVDENKQTYLSGDTTFTEKTIRGGFKFQKNDYDTGTYAQGDTNLQATLKIINESTNPVWVDSNGDGQFSEDEYYANGETIKLPQSFVTVGTANTTDGTFTTTEEGYFETITTALPYGSYKIVEVTAPTGFAMDGNSVTETTFDVTEQGVLVDKTYDIKNEVFTGTFDIQKMLTSTNNGQSTTMKPEENVEFTALLKVTVDEKFGGDYKAAYKAIFGQEPNVEGNATPDDSETKYDENGNILFTTKEYDVVTTNKSGMAYSRDLAYGEYYIFQSSHADSVYDYEGNVSDYDGVIFNVTEENQATKHYYVANNHQLYTLAMHKTSLQTGETVEYTNAKYKITDEDGNTVTQKVGNKNYDTFSTTTRQMIVDSADGQKIEVEAGTFVTETPTDDDAGMAYTALGVEGGKYYITEVETPDGFTKLEEPVEVTVTEKSITEKDEDGTYFIETEIADTQITGTLNIDKTINTWEDADFTTVNVEEDIQKIGFTLTAAEDIINPSDGSVLVKAGEQAVRLTGDRKNPYEKVNEIYLDSEGNATVTGLPMGKYTLTETTAPDYIVKAEPQTIEFVQEEGNTEKAVYEVTAKVENSTTRNTIKKTNVAGKEIGGASMSVTDEDGNVVTSWTSVEGEDYNIEGLSMGKTYTLHEDLAPLGYVKASSIDFTVDETGAVATTTMVDKIVSINKTDGNGNEVEGAKITITDEEGNTVDEWTSTNEKHYVNNLEVGKTYTWHEDYSEEIFGYYYAEDYTFTVTDDGIDQELEMVDSPIKYQIAKVDDNGDYVKGVTLTLTDITDKDNPTTVELPNDGVTTDEPFELDKVLGAEHTYELVESEYVGGVYKATKMQFTVPKHGTSDVTTITMEDTLTNVSVSKIDNHGERVKGAKMSILEATKNEDGTITPATDENGVEKEPIYTFTSEEKATDISQYVKGSNEESGDVWYILREDEAPFGFEKCEDQPFKVTGTNEEHQVLVAVDTRKQYYVSAVKVDKQDENKLLKGAELTLYTSDGKVAKEVSGKEAKGLTDGQGNITWCVEYNGDGTTDTLTGYYVMETKAPTGYKLNTDKHEVTLSESYDFANDDPIKIVITDEQIPKTPDTSDINHLAFYAGLLMLATGAFLLLERKRKKQ